MLGGLDRVSLLAGADLLGCEVRCTTNATYHPDGRYSGGMATKEDLLDDAIAVIRRGEALTADAVARESGLTKPGVMYHFSDQGSADHRGG